MTQDTIEAGPGRAEVGRLWSSAMETVHGAEVLERMVSLAPSLAMMSLRVASQSLHTGHPTADALAGKLGLLCCRLSMLSDQVTLLRRAQAGRPVVIRRVGLATKTELEQMYGGSGLR